MIILCWTQTMQLENLEGENQIHNPVILAWRENKTLKKRIW